MTPQLDYSEAMGRAVRGAIAQADLSIADAAERLGSHPNQLSRRLNGHVEFTWPDLVKVAAITGVPIEDLVRSAERIRNQGVAV